MGAYKGTEFHRVVKNFVSYNPCCNASGTPWEAQQHICQGLSVSHRTGCILVMRPTYLGRP